ncbi:uncharacterized protein C8R40DRAFT_1124318 [Lentinula edodes]|uniref:uncharacterized protein n=1 Tax=Lentinula edodes TaxID=5353 RepID=UPI001E8DA7F3|nr:uncharacterized protein C8R40DRAFT_1124318 [Lentinula edodes]KAH7870894.1 hypothetical protein C8R40DRAFT_1124318 [Lentinula edodes]
MAMANSSSGKRGKDAGRSTGKDPAREAIETSLLSFSKELYRTLDTKQAEIQRLTETLERAENDSKELTTSNATLQTISNRLAYTIESLAKSEEQLKVVNELLLEANEARKSVDEARKSAEDSKKDALSQRDWFKSELDRIRIEWSAKSSESQTLLDQTRVELKDIKFEFNNAKAESKEACNELEAIRLEKDTARNERDQAVKMLHQAQLQTEEWKREYEKREGEVTHLHTQIAYWKDQAKKWHAFVVDSTHRQSKKIKSESAIAAVAPLTPASASGYSSRRRGVDDEEQSEEIEDEDDTDPDSPIDSQRRRNPVATTFGNTTTLRQGAGVDTFNATGSEGNFQTPKTLTRTPKKPSTSGLTSTARAKAATSTSSAHPSSSSKPALSRNEVLLSSRARRRDEVGTSHDNRGRQEDEVHSRDLNDPEDSQGEYERDKSLSSLVYPADPDRVLPIPPRTPHNPRIPRIRHDTHQASHDDRITHPVIAPTSSTSKAKAPPRSVIHSRLIRPVREYQFVVDIKEEDDEPGVISGSSGGKVNGPVHHTSNREVFEDVYDGEIEDDELEEPSGDDTQPTPTRERAKRKGKARATERVLEHRSQSAWNLFDDEQVEDSVGVEAETAPVVGSLTGIGSSSKRRGRECSKKTGRVKSRGKSDIDSSRSRSRLKPKPKHVDGDNDLDDENDPNSEHGDDGDNKVEYHRPIQRTRHRANPSRLSSPSLASSEDELMITSNGVGGIGDSPKTTRTGASRTPHHDLHHDSYSSHPSSSKKRPPTPLTSNTSDGGTASRKRRKR